MQNFHTQVKMFFCNKLVKHNMWAKVFRINVCFQSYNIIFIHNNIQTWTLLKHWFISAIFYRIVSSETRPHLLCSHTHARTHTRKGMLAYLPPSYITSAAKVAPWEEYGAWLELSGSLCVGGFAGSRCLLIIKHASSWPKVGLVIIKVLHILQCGEWGTLRITGPTLLYTLLCV